MNHNAFVLEELEMNYPLIAQNTMQCKHKTSFRIISYWREG